MYAIVATGGKQIKVTAGDVVTVEKLDAAVGESVTFDVIFLGDGEEITVNPSDLASVKVTGEVVEQFKGEKAIVFKFKKRKGYKRLKGHRQNLTKVLITGVQSDEKPKAKKTVAKKSDAKADVVEDTAVEAAEPQAAVAVETAEKKTTSRAKKTKAPEETDTELSSAAEQE
jgi:large subunit ribosomal protein L21